MWNKAAAFVKRVHGQRILDAHAESGADVAYDECYLDTQAEANEDAVVVEKTKCDEVLYEQGAPDDFQLDTLSLTKRRARLVLCPSGEANAMEGPTFASSPYHTSTSGSADASDNPTNSRHPGTSDVRPESREVQVSTVSSSSFVVSEVPSDMRKQFSELTVFGEEARKCFEEIDSMIEMVDDADLAAAVKEMGGKLACLLCDTEQFIMQYIASIADTRARVIPCLRGKRKRRHAVTSLLGMCQGQLQEMMEHSRAVACSYRKVLSDLSYLKSCVELVQDDFEMTAQLAADSEIPPEIRALQQASGQMKNAAKLLSQSSVWSCLRGNQRHLIQLEREACQLRGEMLEMGKDAELPSMYDSFCSSLEQLCIFD